MNIPRCPRCDSSECPAASLEWRDVSATANGWLPADTEEFYTRSLREPSRHGCARDPVDWRARAMKAETALLKIAERADSCWQHAVGGGSVEGFWDIRAWARTALEDGNDH